MKVNDKVICVNTKPIGDNDVAPPLEYNTGYTIKEIILDSKGNHHFDVGLVSRYNYIRSIETEEELPRGNKVHWCHPSRFALV